MWWQALLNAGMAYMAKESQENTNDTNVALGREQMAFQERMSSSAYQRAVMDMQAAGLNPMLAYSQGGASAPIGSMPQVQNPLTPALATAMQGVQMAQAVQQISQSREQTEFIKAQAEQVRTKTLTNEINTAQAMASLGLTETEIKKRVEQVIKERYGAMTAQMQFRAANETKDTPDVPPDTRWASDVRQRKAESKLRELEIPEREASAKFFNHDLGEASPFLRQIYMLLNALGSMGIRR